MKKLILLSLALSLNNQYFIFNFKTMNKELEITKVCPVCRKEDIETNDRCCVFCEDRLAEYEENERI